MLAAMPMQVVATSQRRNSHRVDDAKPGRNAAARRVDVELDVGLGIVVGKKQQLGDDRVGRFIGDRAAEDDDAVLQQAGIDVIGPLAAAGFFDDDGDQYFAVISISRFSAQFEVRFLRGRERRRVFPPPIGCVGSNKNFTPEILQPSGTPRRNRSPAGPGAEMPG